MPPKLSGVERWTGRYLRSDPPRCRSLIITVFGDSLLPSVSGLQLRELIALLRPFQVTSQLARTSAFRLVQEGWLQSHREGRTSRYSLTSTGQERVQQAYRRIYDPPNKDWNGQWTLLIPGPEGSSGTRGAELRRELEWAGYGRLTARLFVQPQPDRKGIHELLDRLNLAEETIVLQAFSLEGFSPQPAAVLTARCWDLRRVALHYDQFLKKFRAVPSLLERDLQPEAAFVLQTLLIHAFRRVVLHDPRLPSALVPENWPGHAAYELCRSVYCTTYTKAQRYLSERLSEGGAGALAHKSEFLARFGGLLCEDSKTSGR